MKPMEFSTDPGALPFTCRRRRKWMNRIWVGDMIEVRGQNPALFPQLAAVVLDIRKVDEETCEIDLGPAPAGWRKSGHPVHGDWVFEPALPGVSDANLLETQ